MASKPKKPAIKPGKQARQAEAKRFAQAEQACRLLMALFAQLSHDGALEANETARQCAQMAGIYYKKIRNGKVIAPADFNLSVQLCVVAERALLALDPTLQFADYPDPAQLQYGAQQAREVQAALQALKTATKPR